MVRAEYPKVPSVVPGGKQAALQLSAKGRFINVDSFLCFVDGWRNRNNFAIDLLFIHVLGIRNQVYIMKS